ncbi:TPA: type II toxin-antitoxin system YafO family toxin [Enterobacter hormaechei]|uniref:type II toxin-antitoxin system YafO family toxin n=1 Tax=Enterobacter hormaechei TaxID=158836 RepID=UPI0023E44240|nr:type II toxin-antitoxin system YafO family toxin [Enterobacter hormaechei]
MRNDRTSSNSCSDVLSGPENYNRTSDHYLIYTEHMWDSGRFLVTGLITPAHERMPARDTRLLSNFSEVAGNFQAS